MLQVSSHRDADRLSDDSASPQESLASLLQILRRQSPTIIAILSACILVALLYLFTAAPRFTSTASLVIDTRKVQLFQQSMLGEPPVDSVAVETQVEILKSENISLGVIKDLRLIDDLEFTGNGKTLLVSLIDFFTPGGGEEVKRSEFELTRAALTQFENNRTIKRLGLTYVMEVGFTSLVAAKAARIANAIADGYIVDQLEAKYQSTRRASVWLQDRIKELRMQASAAQRAVVDFKQNNNIVDAGGRLMTEQQLAEVNSQLILARAATAEAKARLERINDIMRQEIPDASVADALKNDTIVKLRGQYVDMASKEAIWSAKYGRDHMAAVNLRTQMQEIKRNITDELKRIQQSYKSDYDIAQTREESIKRSLASVVTESQTSNQAQIQLRELESNAQSYQAMYDNFLQRYMESVQQQSFPVTDARIITMATPPLLKSAPKALIVLAGGLVGGLMLSIGVAMAREYADNVFRTTTQVEDALQANCIAVLPVIKAAGARPGRKLLERRDDPAAPAAPSQDLMRYVVDHPLSRFSEAIRSLKVAVDLNSIVRQNRVVAVTSTLPNEGKSTLSVNLAQLIAHGGASVILVDADLRNPSLSRRLGSSDRQGLIEVVAGKAELRDAVSVDAATGLAFLSAGTTSKMLHTTEILASKATCELFSRLRSLYDYVIVDMSPMAPVVDVRVTSSFIDSYVFVVEWGETKIDVVRHNLRGAPEIHERLLGIVLNKADIGMLARYESHHGNYYSKYYARYGYTE